MELEKEIDYFCLFCLQEESPIPELFTRFLHASKNKTLTKENFSILMECGYAIREKSKEEQLYLREKLIKECKKNEQSA